MKELLPINLPKLRMNLGKFSRSANYRISMSSFIILIVFTVSFTTTIFAYFLTQQAIAQTTQSGHVEQLKILLNDAILALQKGDTNSALVHLKLADQQMANSIQLSTNTSRTQQNVNTTAKITFSTYGNPVLGITLQYPSNWSKSEYPYNPGANNTIVSFFSRSESASTLGNISGVSGNFVPYIDLFVFPSKNVSLEEAVRQTVNNFENNAHVDVSKPIALKGNIPAHLLVYDSIVANDEHFKKMQVWVLSGDKIYVLTYTSEASLYPNYLPIIQKMIQSVELKNSPHQTINNNNPVTNNSLNANSQRQQDTTISTKPFPNGAGIAENRTSGVPWLS